MKSFNRKRKPKHWTKLKYRIIFTAYESKEDRYVLRYGLSTNVNIKYEYSNGVKCCIPEVIVKCKKFNWEIFNKRYKSMFKKG